MEDRIRQQWKPGHAHGGHRPPPPGLAAQAVHSADEAEFLRAMAAYQERTGRKFPTWSEAKEFAVSTNWAFLWLKVVIVVLLARV
jgi:hypothetical protein